MDPIYLGHTQCFNVDNQCFVGEDLKHRLDTDQTLKQAFIDGCKTENPKNAELRCCPLSLMNRPYFPTKDKIPVHVKKMGGNEFKMCPESIQSQCVRETDPASFILCVAEKCNDAGFLEASNYYQICKAYKELGDTQSVPDCPTATCSKMMKLPQWYLDKLESPTDNNNNNNNINNNNNNNDDNDNDNNDNNKTNDNNMNYNKLNVANNKDDLNNDSKITLKYMLSLLPTENDFYNWGAIILGVVTMIIIIIVGIISTKK
jgi:hypothetical protein